MQLRLKLKKVVKPISVRCAQRAHRGGQGLGQQGHRGLGQVRPIRHHRHQSRWGSSDVQN